MPIRARPERCISASWWLHTILVARFFATLPVNRFLHVITGPINIAARPERPMGALVPLTMEEVEADRAAPACTSSTISPAATAQSRRLHGMRPLRRRLPRVGYREAAFAQGSRG